MWPQLLAIYSSVSPPKPHSFQPWIWVLVCRHQWRSLELRWKGPFLVILMIPTTLKVDGLAPWILTLPCQTLEKETLRMLKLKIFPGQPDLTLKTPCSSGFATNMFKTLLILWLCPMATSKINPHTLWNQTWMIINTETVLPTPAPPQKNLRPRGFQNYM